MNLVEQTLWKTVDADPQRRPGVPAERPPGRTGHAHWLEPEKQPPRPDVVKDAQRTELTATFGTGQPPHGLSGLMRCAAYEIPDYQPRRWLLLVLADRVDSLEGRLASLAASPAMWGPPSARRPSWLEGASAAAFALLSSEAVHAETVAVFEDGGLGEGNSRNPGLETPNNRQFHRSIAHGHRVAEQASRRRHRSLERNRPRAREAICRTWI
ncbi:MAG: hypothetical protein M3O36_17810 [Myxococcota bacterium]|nr:hypothetical protein [Myxococcota bacterium]